MFPWPEVENILVHRYYANTETYLKAVALKRMPPNLQTVDMLKAGEVFSFYLEDRVHAEHHY